MPFWTVRRLRARAKEKTKMAFGEQGGFGQKRQLFPATCSECGNQCEVPFQPKADRPVYCRDCFAKRKPRGPM
jgi:CxxC-x17-CxxC domain-containing protein